MNGFFEVRDTDISTTLADNIDFDTHLHNDIEIVYVIHGSVRLRLDDVDYEINRDNFAIIFPDQIHGYSHSRDLLAYVLVFSASILGTLQRYTRQCVPETPVISESTTTARRLLDLFFALDPDKPSEIFNGLLCSVCGLLFDELTFKKTSRYDMSTLKNLLIYCEEHCTDHITPDSVARELHISRSHISHLFKSKLNTTFYGYINKSRIRHACRMLSEGHSVADTALASGFGSIRTFNRTFNAIMGIPPSAYKSKR